MHRGSCLRGQRGLKVSYPRKHSVEAHILTIGDVGIGRLFQGISLKYERITYSFSKTSTQLSHGFLPPCTAVRLYTFQLCVSFWGDNNTDIVRPCPYMVVHNPNHRQDV